MADLSAREVVLKETTTQDLQAGALSYTTSFGTDFRALSIMVHRTGAGAGAVFEIWYDSPDGANYDVKLDSASIAGGDTYAYFPPDNTVFPKGAEMRLTAPQQGSSGVLYVTILAVDA